MVVPVQNAVGREKVEKRDLGIFFRQAQSRIPEGALNLVSLFLGQDLLLGSLVQAFVVLNDILGVVGIQVAPGAEVVKTGGGVPLAGKVQGLQGGAAENFPVEKIVYIVYRIVVIEVGGIVALCFNQVLASQQKPLVHAENHQFKFRLAPDSLL